MDFEQKVYNTLRKSHPTERLVVRRHKVAEKGHFFFLKGTERACYVQDRLRKMQPHFLEFLGIERFEDLNHVSEEPFCTYGAVINITSARMSPEAIHLVNSIDGSNSVPVRLNLAYVANYSLFPGQLVAIRGRNVSGDEIVAEEIGYTPSLDVNNTECTDFSHLYSRKPLEIITASGPFSENNVEFGSMERLLEQSPDMFILHGPFFAPCGGFDERDPFEVFRGELLSRLVGWLRKTTTSRVVIVPHLEDIIAMRLIPQLPFTFDDFDGRILYLSNPSMFFVNEFLFATSSSDLLLPLISEECFLAREGQPASSSGGTIFSCDRVERMCYHLVFQKTFFPVFPAAFPVSFQDLRIVDVDIAPDFLVFSSKVWCFKKEVGPTTIINHGCQTKVENKCYSKITIGPRGTRHNVEFCEFAARQKRSTDASQPPDSAECGARSVSGA